MRLRSSFPPLNPRVRDRQDTVSGPMEMGKACKYMIHMGNKTPKHFAWYCWAVGIIGLWMTLAG